MGKSKGTGVMRGLLSEETSSPLDGKIPSLGLWVLFPGNAWSRSGFVQRFQAGGQGEWGPQLS